ncbi:MAG: hypothetical protein FJ100_08515 [Deltaproteobacteria bacterium]|nr:hypothetical protein [Deltaproteobacteria bacterium]
MEFQLKTIHAEAVPRALAKADHYRLLNEPREAESICRDVLACDPGNQKALTSLALALSDQFAEGDVAHAVKDAEVAIGQLQDPYERAYFGGLVVERRAKAQQRRGVAGFYVFEGLRKAMHLFEQAIELAPAGNEDAVLRWNTCARMIMADANLRPETPSDAWMLE